MTTEPKVRGSNPLGCTFLTLAERRAFAQRFEVLACFTRCLALRPLRCLRLFFGFPSEVLACAKERVEERREDDRLAVDRDVDLPFE